MSQIRIKANLQQARSRQWSGSRPAPAPSGVNAGGRRSSQPIGVNRECWAECGGMFANRREPANCWETVRKGCNLTPLLQPSAPQNARTVPPPGRFSVRSRCPVRYAAGTKWHLYWGSWPSSCPRSHALFLVTLRRSVVARRPSRVVCPTNVLYGAGAVTRAFPLNLAMLRSRWFVFSALLRDFQAVCVCSAHKRAT